MNNTFAIITFVVLGLGTNLATAAMDNTYVTVKGGLSGIHSQEEKQASTELKVDYKKRFNIGAAVGQKLGVFRSELEGNYNYTEVNDVDTKITGSPELHDSSNNKSGSIVAVTLNGYYDINMDPNVKPYIGLGAGWGHVQSNFIRKLASGKTEEVNKSGNTIVFQGIVGVQYYMNHVMSIFLEYKYLGTTKVIFATVDGNDYKHEFMIHNVNLGFKFTIA